MVFSMSAFFLHNGTGWALPPAFVRSSSEIILEMAAAAFPMISVSEALNHVLSACRRLGEEDVLEVSLNECLGLVLAEDVVAKMPHPPFDTTISDGYAVRSADSGKILKISQHSVLAGSSPHPLNEGECCYVATGAPLPAGADAVCKEEDVKLSPDDATSLWMPSINEKTDVRTAGSDHAAGDVLVERGTELKPWDCGLAASVGLSTVRVFRRPRVCVFSTGNELVVAGDPLDPTRQVYDANRASLLAVAKAQGAECVDGGLLRDDADELYKALLTSTADIIVTTGGVSVGRADFAKSVLAKLSAEVKFGRLHMKPGKPTTFATLTKNRLYFGLPGNPVSAVVTAQLLLVPALRRLKGIVEASCPAPIVDCELAESVKLDPVRPEYRRVTLSHREGGLFTAKGTGFQRSSRLVSMRDADALALVPERRDGVHTLPAGTVVPAILIGQIPPRSLPPSTRITVVRRADGGRSSAFVEGAEEKEDLASALESDDSDVVVVFGGVGLASTDTSVEEVRTACERPAPGLSHAMSRAMKDPLQRPFAALKGNVLVLAVPDDPHQARLCLEVARPVFSSLR